MIGSFLSSQRWWRYRIFILTWLVYAGFYLCRKNLSVVMPMLMEDLGYTKGQLAWTITGYSLIYMLGQFGNGVLSDRFGPRLVVGIGLLVAVVSNVAMGLGASVLVLFGLLNMVNGYGQSTGWSGTIKNMSAWFTREERGRVMAWWSTCYALGGGIATLFAAHIATHETFFPQLGWRRGFFAPAALLLVIAVLYILFTRNRPSDAGFEDFHEDALAMKEGKETNGEDTRALWIAVLSSPALWITGFMYFFLKLMRYAFLYWMPTYLATELGYTARVAGYASSSYEVAGFCGVVLAGYASDVLFGSRRFPVACIMLLGLAAVSLLYPVAATYGLWINVLGISLIGVMTFGPDSLMTGAGAMDLGSEKAAGMASGFINGMGSIGQLLSPLVVAYVSDSRFGWNGVFYLFVPCALIGAALMATKWNYGAAQDTKVEAKG